MAQILIVGAWAVTLAVNAPGHLSYDSVVQLAEGRTLAFGNWTGDVLAHPPIMSLLLGLFDTALPGTALYLLVVSGLFFGALLVVVSRAHRVGPAALLVLALLLGTPLVLIYQGIVWKDVLFANLALMAFALLLVAPPEQSRRRLGMIAAAVTLGSIAALVRQNGVIILFFVVLTACLMQAGDLRRKRMLLRVSALTVGITMAAFASATVAQAILLRAIAEKLPEDALPSGVVLLARYDIAGILARGGSDVGALERIGVDAHSARQMAIANYGPDRIDRLLDAGFLGWLESPEAVIGAWADMITANPLAYAGHRFAVLGWLVWPADPEVCLPVHVGIAGRPDIVEGLGLVLGGRPQDHTLYFYARQFGATPLFLHGIYLFAAAGLIGFLAVRRPQDARVLLPMLASAIAFTLSFGVIGIACDFRYAYFLPVALGVAALAISCARPEAKPVLREETRIAGTRT